MPKLAPCLTASPHPRKPGMLVLRFPFSLSANATLKQYPGCRWDPTVNSWIGPEELSNVYSALAVSHGWEQRLPAKRAITPNGELVNPKLYPFQADAVRRLLREQRLLLNFEMGLGKTASAIEAMRLSNVATAMIVCPAIVRRVWEQELDRWWPGHPVVQVFTCGKDTVALVGSIFITSYELLAKLPIREYGAIIIDECHYIKSYKAARTKEVTALVATQPKTTLIALLTGTAITNEPVDLYSQLDCAWPDRFGNWNKFTETYCGKVDNEHAKRGYSIKGLTNNVAKADELRQRLTACCARVTKKEVAHLLPPLTTLSLRVPALRPADFRELSDALERSDKHRARVFLESMVSQKVEQAVEWCAEALGNVSHVCVLTHLRATATTVGAQLKDEGIAAQVITGDMPPDERGRAIDELKAKHTGVLVATMHSIGTGIDLTAFSNVICIELYDSPGVMSQVFARFHRLSGKLPVTLTLLVIEGTREEIVARRVEQKLSDAASIIEAGTVESKMTKALSSDEMTDEEMMAALREVASKRVEEDEYV